jgi:hypothetical protein
MAITVKKKALATKAKAAVDTTGINETIDQMGDIYMKLTPAKDRVRKLEKEYKPLFTEVQAFVDLIAPDHEEYTISSERYAATFTPHPETKTIVSGKAVYDALEEVQPGLGDTLMQFSITDLGKYLPGNVIDKLVSKNRTKARSVKVAKIEG